MIKPTRKVSSVSLAALCAFFAVSKVPGQSTPPANPSSSSGDSGSELITLPAFDVSSKSTDPYRATDAISVTRTAGSILDAPLSVHVVTPQLIQDIGPNAVFEVNRYFAGVSPGRGTGGGGIMDRQDFRGFESFSKTIDNFSSFLLPIGQGFQANFDPVLIEHAELVMGPDSILSPTGTPGGSINIITKSPRFNQAGEISYELGNFAANKLTFDFTGPLGDSKHMAYRVIGAYQDGNTYVPGDIRSWTGSAQFTYQFTTNSKVTVKYFGEQWGLTGAIANPNGNGEMVSAPDTLNGATLSDTPQPGFSYRGWNGDATWSHRWDRLNILQAEFTSALSDRINMRFAAQILFDNFTQDSASPSTNPAETFDQTTGAQIGVVPLVPTALSEVATINHAINRDVQIQNDYAGNFEVGKVKLSPVVGFAYQKGNQPVQYQIQDRTMPTANLADGSYSPPRPDISQYKGFSANIPEHAWILQTYALMKTSFLDDRLFVTTGAARTFARVYDYAYPGITLPGVGLVGSAGAPALHTFDNTGLAAAPSGKDYHDTYLFGVVGKLAKNISTYYSLSTNAGIAQNSPIWQAGKQHEFGVKAEFFDRRLAFGADHFQINESNVSAVNPLFNTGQSSISTILANETNHGYEFNVVGGITPELSVIGSFTTMKLRDPAGRRIRNVPDKIATLLLNYHPTRGPLTHASAFIGIVHQGNTAGENAPNLGYTSLSVPQQVGFYVAPWTVVNVGAGYEWDRYRFRLNIDNALNDKFWWQPASRQSVSPYPGLTVRFTTTVKL